MSLIFNMQIPFPTSMMVQDTTATLSAVSQTLSNVFKSTGYDPSTLWGIPAFIFIENMINGWVKNYNLPKGNLTLVLAWMLGVVIEVLAAIAMGWDIKSAIMTGIGIGLLANLYHDRTKNETPKT